MFAVDTVLERLELAREFGATPLSLAAPAPHAAASANAAARRGLGGTVPADPSAAAAAGAASKGASEQHEVGVVVSVGAPTAATSRDFIAGFVHGSEGNGDPPAPVNGSEGSEGRCGAPASICEGSSGAATGASGTARTIAGATLPSRPAEAEEQGPSGARGTAGSAGTGVSAALPDGGPGDPPSSAKGAPSGAAGVLAAVRAATGGRGADVVLEAVGSQAAVRLAHELIRPGGEAPGLASYTFHHSSRVSPAHAHGSWPCSHFCFCW